MPNPNDTQSIAAETASGPRRQLSLLDSTCIIVGIIIGSGIYELTPLIASNVSSPGMLLGVWLSGGVVAFAGALCYAELATAYPVPGVIMYFCHEPMAVALHSCLPGLSSGSYAPVTSA